VGKGGGGERKTSENAAEGIIIVREPGESFGNVDGCYTVAISCLCFRV